MSNPIFPALEKLLGKIPEKSALEKTALDAAKHAVSSNLVAPLVVPTSAGSPFTEIAIKHESLKLGVPSAFNLAGKSIYLKRWGTSSNTRFSVIIGNKITALIPGSRITGSFDSFQIVRENAIFSDQQNVNSGGSAFPKIYEGVAVFVISNTSASYDEPDNPVDILSPPCNLIGSIYKYSNTYTASGPSAQDYLSTINTQISHWFPIASGVSRLRVILYNANASNAWNDAAKFFFLPMDFSAINDLDVPFTNGYFPRATDLDFNFTIPIGPFETLYKTVDVSAYYGWMHIVFPACASFPTRIYRVQGVS